MAWFTTRYQNASYAKELGLVLIGHTRSQPRFKLGAPLDANIPALAPQVMTGDWQTAYRSKLDKLGADVVVELINAASGNKDCVLMCYEHIEIEGEDSCHRRVLASWLEKQVGLVVPELEDRGKISAKLKALQRATVDGNQTSLL